MTKCSSTEDDHYDSLLTRAFARFTSKIVLFVGKVLWLKDAPSEKVSGLLLYSLLLSSLLWYLIGGRRMRLSAGEARRH